MTKKSTPKGVLTVRNRKTGLTYRYAWRGGPRLFSEPGTPAFEREYAEALDSTRPAGGTFGDLVLRYRQSAEFATLAPRTRKDMALYLDKAASKFGHASIAAMEDLRMRGKVKAWRDSMADTPRKADLCIEALRRVLNYAIDAGEMKHNVAARIKPLHSADRSGEIWSPEEIEAVKAEQNHAGQNALDFIRLTGLRREDACRIPWSADKGSHLEWSTGKSRGRITAIVPVLPELRALLDSMKRRDKTILTNMRGKPWTPDGLSSNIDKAKRKAGVDKRIHDLRGTFATYLMERGLDDREIAEIIAWSERDVAKIRRRYISREAIVRAALAKMEGGAS